MARRGFFGRIRDAIRNVVAPPTGRHRPQPPPEPPRPPTPTGPSRNEYREIWRDYATPRGASYQSNLAAFHAAIDPIEEDPQERLDLWRSYVRNIVAGEGQFRRNDTANLFWRDTGMDPRDFNWQRWRAAMGFTGKNRSRTS